MLSCCPVDNHALSDNNAIIQSLFRYHAVRCRESLNVLHGRDNGSCTPKPTEYLGLIRLYWGVCTIMHWRINFCKLQQIRTYYGYKERQHIERASDITCARRACGQLADAAAVSGGRTSCPITPMPPSWNYDALLVTRLRQSMGIYLENNPAKFWRGSHQQQQQQEQQQPQDE